MKHAVLVIATLVAAAVLLSACSSDKKNDSTATPAATAAAVAPGAPKGTVAAPSPTAAAGKWDKSTIFDYGVDTSSDMWQQGCGKNPIAVQADDPCVMQVMKLGKASDSAVEFYQQYKHFLVTFDEHGHVDFGQTGVPWENMGRPTQFVFLNGSPDFIPVPIPDDYKKDPSYGKVLTPPPATPGSTLVPLQDFPWGEYGQLTAATSNSSGQQFVVSYPMRGCRACADDGYLPIAYNFDTQGKLTGSQTMPFKPK